MLTLPERHAIREAAQELRAVADALQRQDRTWIALNADSARYYLSLALRLEDLHRRVTQEGGD
jgi:hypothetical protein